MATRSCPFCAEEIQAAAIVCRHCQRDVTPAIPAAEPSDAPAQSPRVAAPYIAVALGLAALMALPIVALPNGGANVAGYMGRFTAHILFPAIIAFIARGRKRDWRGFGRWLFWLVLLMPMLMKLGRTPTP